MAQARLAWNRRSVRLELPAGVHRDRHRGRLRGHAGRPHVLSPTPDRRSEMEGAASRDRDRLDPVGRARLGCRIGRIEVVAARGGARAGRSDRLPARRSGVRRARPRWRACRATGAERAPAPRSAGDRLRGRRRSAVAGQFEAKRGAPAGRGLGVDLPSVGLNYRPGDRQPEPCPSAVS